MIVPTKFTSLDESILGKSPAILMAFEKFVSIHDLYKLVEQDFEDAGEFLYAIDILYVLGSIQFDSKTGVVGKC